MKHADANHERLSAGPILELVEQLARELHPSADLRVGLDSLLDQELGIDSLARAELLRRMERRFGLSLPEQLLYQADTPRDLLRAAGSARQGIAEGERREAEAQVLGGVRDRPDRAGTLVEMLDWHVQAHAERTHIHLFQDGDRTTAISYGELLANAGKVAAGLRRLGFERGFSASIMLPTSRDYFASFFGILLAGGVPVPIYPPARPSQLEDHLRRHAAILGNARARVLITVAQALPVARLLKSQVAGLDRTLTVEDLIADASGGGAPAAPRPDDLAFLQYTSGSTGQPKGVQLTHANLLANIRAMGAAAAVTPDDVFVSWLPLYHDMGLIGAWLGSLYYATPLVLMSPLAFLARPSRWLWAIHNHRGTLSAAPNFAYELCIAKVEDEEIRGLDLGSWRLAFNGAEPVSPQTVRRFAERFGHYGLRPEAMAPVYGLAESSVGLTFPPPGRGPVIDRVGRRSLEGAGEAVPAEPGEPDALEIVGCGTPIPGHEVRVVDAQGREQPDRREGRLQFRGPSATSGYFNNPEATRGLFAGEWLESGDLAYLADGEVFPTSRAKDIIIRAGRNLYPYELEQAVGELPGVRKGCVAVFGSRDPDSGTERLVVLAETREVVPGARERLQASIRAAASDLLGMPPDEVVLAPPHSVLKTSSGKIRRAACRELYESGRLGRGERRVWVQLLHLALSGLGPALRKGWRSFAESAYAGYCWLLFGLLAPFVWLLVAVLPGRRWRWAVIRGASRMLLALTGVPLAMEGKEYLPPGGSYMIAANHASYLDGLLLVAALPVEVDFVAKAEFRGKFFAETFLRRIGTSFVDRMDSRRGIEDLQRLGGPSRPDRVIAFFPEGTFGRMPGLLEFRMGAFVLATESGVPVVPVAIRGSRHLLRGDSWFPRWGRVRIIAGEAIPPSGTGWRAAVELRDRVRREILRGCGEPDIGR